MEGAVLNAAPEGETEPQNVVTVRTRTRGRISVTADMAERINDSFIKYATQRLDFEEHCLEVIRISGVDARDFNDVEIRSLRGELWVAAGDAKKRGPQTVEF